MVFLMIPAFVMFEYGIGLFLSAIYVFARDIKYLYSVFLTLWTYITPIFYKVEVFKVGSLAYNAIHVNPMYYFIKFFREAVYLGWSGNLWQDLGLLYLLGFVSISIGTAVFKPLKKRFMMHI